MAGEFETGETGDEAAPTLPGRQYLSDVALPLTLPLRVGAEAIKGVGGLAADLARARGYLPPAADAVDPSFADVVGGSSGPVPAAPSGEPIPPPDMVAPPAAAKSAGRTRAAPPANATPPSDGPGTDAIVPPAPAAAPVAAAVPGPYTNPLVAAYMADRASRVAALQDAQKEAARRGELAMAVGSLSGFGVKDGAGEAEARQAWANAPVANLQAQQKAQADALEEAGKQQEFTSRLEAADPRSPANAAFRDFYAGMNPPIRIPPSMTLAQGGPLVENFLKRQKDAEDNARALTIERESRKSAEGIAARHESGENYRAGLKEKQAANEKPLPPAATKEVEDALEVAETTPDLRAKQKDVGMVTGALGKLGIHVGAEGEYNDAVKAASGTIARAEFPGARGPQGARQVQNTLPSGITPSDRAGEQYNNIDKVAINRAETKLAALKAAHPNHPQIAELESRLAKAKAGSGAASAGGGRTMTGKDGRQYQWDGHGWLPVR